MSKDSFLWEGHDRYLTRLKDITVGSSTVLFYREQKSHQGIGKLKQIMRLGARMVNQAFLDELSELESLEELKLEGVSAGDLSPISKLKNLRTLRLRDVSEISNFEAVLGSGLIDHIQKMTIAAMAMADMKVCAQRS